MGEEERKGGGGSLRKIQFLINFAARSADAGQLHFRSSASNDVSILLERGNFGDQPNECIGQRKNRLENCASQSDP